MNMLIIYIPLIIIAVIWFLYELRKKNKKITEKDITEFGEEDLEDEIVASIKKEEKKEMDLTDIKSYEDAEDDGVMRW